MQTLTIGQNRIAYAIEGPADAPVLVLSNSLGTSMELWQAQATVLSQHFRILRYDTRGHGQSTRTTMDDTHLAYTLAELAGDVLTLLDSLDIKKASFCGISMGGLIGLWLGANAGHRFERLIIANSAARIGSEAGWLERASAVRAQGMAQVADGAAARWFTPAFRAAFPAISESLIEGLRRTDPKGYAACCIALAHADLRAELRSIAVPTLLLAGQWDPVTTVDDALYIAKHVPDAKYVQLNASHLSNVEAPKAFTDEILHFLELA